ncbi:outer membrane efflux protein, partial [delta proteobacterium NaphS2]
VAELSEEQLIYNVKTLYVNILALQHQLSAQQSYVKALKALLADLQHEVKLGKKARIDILKAAADLEKARAQKSRINSNLTIVRATLAGLLNLSVLPDLEEVPTVPKPSKAFNTEIAVKNSGRYQYAVMEVAKNAKQVEKSKSAYYPQVTFNAFYGQNFGPNDSSNRYSGDWNNQEIWQTVVTLTWNIFDFGARKSVAQKARIQKKQSEKKKQTTALELKTALIEARTQIQTAIKEYESAGAEEKMTRETETIERVRFDNGAISVNDLLYAQARHQQATARLISARYACLSARFYLDYLLEKGKQA